MSDKILSEKAFIKTYSPYIFLVLAFSLFGLWSSKNIQPGKLPERHIASDCDGMFKQIINNDAEKEKLKKLASIKEESEKLFKMKNTIWNKVVSTSDFNNFNDQEYFRWLEIYKDSSNELAKLNPVTIEQKMALVEVINAKIIPTALNAEKSLTAEAQKLNLLKLKKLQSHMKSFDLSSKLVRSDLEGFAADLMIILKGPPVTLLDYFTVNKTKRMNERLMRMIQEDMLLIGLKGMVDRIPEKESYTRLERGKYLVKRFFQYKIWKYLVVPYDLPWIEKVKIPDALMEKILVDGLDTHDQELIALLNKQGMIDHYERFRKVYKPIAFSVGFYFYFDKFNNNMQGALSDNQEEEKKKLLEEFDNLAQSILETGIELNKSEDAMKEEQFKSVVETYKEKYEQEPSAAELEEMRAAIFKK